MTTFPASPCSVGGSYQSGRESRKVVTTSRKRQRPQPTPQEQATYVLAGMRVGPGSMGIWQALGSVPYIRDLVKRGEFTLEQIGTYSEELASFERVSHREHAESCLEQLRSGTWFGDYPKAVTELQKHLTAAGLKLRSIKSSERELRTLRSRKVEQLAKKFLAQGYIERWWGIEYTIQELRAEASKAGVSLSSLGIEEDYLHQLFVDEVKTKAASQLGELVETITAFHTVFQRRWEVMLVTLDKAKLTPADLAISREDLVEIARL